MTTIIVGLVAGLVAFVLAAAIDTLQECFTRDAESGAATFVRGSGRRGASASSARLAQPAARAPHGLTDDDAALLDPYGDLA